MIQYSSIDSASWHQDAPPLERVEMNAIDKKTFQHRGKAATQPVDGTAGSGGAGQEQVSVHSILSVDSSGPFNTSGFIDESGGNTAQGGTNKAVEKSDANSEAGELTVPAGLDHNNAKGPVPRTGTARRLAPLRLFANMSILAPLTPAQEPFV